MQGKPDQKIHRIVRREMLQVGSLTLGGLTLPGLLQAEQSSALSAGKLSSGKMFGRAKNVIFLYLAGGPPQHETFDPKPNAPSEIRGSFKPISTNIPGIQFCELLPRTAMMADKLAVVRSMATDDNTHSSSGAWVLTGHKYRGANARTITPTDQPYLGSLVKMLKPSSTLPALSSVWIPDMMRLNENVTPAGQTGGFLGSQWDPERFVGDPSEKNYTIESLRQTDVTPQRLQQRKALLSQLELPGHTPGGAGDVYGVYRQHAFDLLTSGQAREAFAIEKEPDRVRDRYGRNRWGQCVLLARRLIESGVRLVHVQWPRENGDNAVDNPLWDTHAQNADRVEDVLCPMFDVGFTALLEDLDSRGLLDETLVVAIGEFGRTPKINTKGGRDHWGSVFSFVMAGAGISGGQVYGSSDKNGGFPTSGRVQPSDLSATIFHLLGIDSNGTFPDRQGRPHPLTPGNPIYPLLGTEPATKKRTEPTGRISRVPPYDPLRYLSETKFSTETGVQPLTASSRPKGWRCDPILPTGTAGFGIQLVKNSPGDSPKDSLETIDADSSLCLGLHTGSHSQEVQIVQGQQLLVAQEVRSPFAGSYRLRVSLSGGGTSAEFFETVFLKNFICELQFVQFTTPQKQFTHYRTLASQTFIPKFSNRENEWETVELSKQFFNPNPGSNFSFGSGMGIAILVRKQTPGTLTLPPNHEDNCCLRLSQVTLEFQGKVVNDNVKV